MSIKYYKVSEKELIRLLSSEAELLELESAGVDNWSGYGEVDWGGLYNTEISLDGYEEVL